jgi:hypothetical protein
MKLPPCVVDGSLQKQKGELKGELKGVLRDVLRGVLRGVLEGEEMEGEN